jgi:hypothetical protein
MDWRFMSVVRYATGSNSQTSPSSVLQGEEDRDRVGGPTLTKS